MKMNIVILLMLPFIGAAHAQSPTTQRNAQLVCGEHSGNPKQLPPFQRTLTFTQAGETLTAERQTKDSKESWTGLVGPSAFAFIVGKGELTERESRWVYEFQGQLGKPNSTLKGRLISTSGAVGGRTCSITF